MWMCWKCWLGPVVRVSGMLAQLVLPGDNPDVASLMLEHESGAISNLTASYASASEHYMMNVYGKEASAYYDLFSGLRHLGAGRAMPGRSQPQRTTPFARSWRNSPIASARGRSPETGGHWATRNLAVIAAGVISARERRVVDVAEALAAGGG